MQTNKPRSIKPQTTDSKLGIGVNWQVTLKQQGVKQSTISNIIIHHELGLFRTV
jgi:hypothetical protein